MLEQIFSSTSPSLINDPGQRAPPTYKGMLRWILHVARRSAGTNFFQHFSPLFWDTLMCWIAGAPASWRCPRVFSPKPYEDPELCWNKFFPAHLPPKWPSDSQKSSTSPDSQKSSTSPAKIAPQFPKIQHISRQICAALLREVQDMKPEI